MCDVAAQVHRGQGPRDAGVSARGSPWCIILQKAQDCGKAHSGWQVKKDVSEGKEMIARGDSRDRVWAGASHPRE